MLQPSTSSIGNSTEQILLDFRRSIINIIDYRLFVNLLTSRKIVFEKRPFQASSKTIFFKSDLSRAGTLERNSIFSNRAMQCKTNEIVLVIDL
jgi:hypothetical protein